MRNPETSSPAPSSLPVRAVGRVGPVAIKEFRQIRRDPRTLVLLLVFPAFLMVLFGFALNFDVKHVSLSVLDQDHTARSRDLTASFLHSEYFDLRRELDDPRDVDRLLDQALTQVVLVIPRGFADDLTRGRETRVQVNVDGSNSNSASAIVGYVSALCQDYSNRVLVGALLHVGQSHVVLPVDYRPRVWYNPELRSAKFLIPGLIAIILLIVTVVSTSLSVVREKERGTIEQIVVSQLRPIEVIVGKTIPYAIISFVAAVVVLFVGWSLFGIVIKGNWFLLFCALVVFLVDGLGMGLLISTLARTQQVAFTISSLLTMLPTVILSGFIFPIRNMPVAIQAVSYLVPARYFLPILRGIILKGVGLAAFWEQMLLLAVFAVAMIALSTARLQRQMS